MPFINVKMLEGRTNEQKTRTRQSDYRCDGQYLRCQSRWHDGRY